MTSILAIWIAFVAASTAVSQPARPYPFTFDDVMAASMRSFFDFDSSKHPIESNYPAAPAFPGIVSAINSQINPRDLNATLTTFVSRFRNRIYDSVEGNQSCEWLVDRVEALANQRSDLKLSVRRFHHPWGQASVLARIEPTNGAPHADILIASAHQDSINWRDRGTDDQMVAPGADDDGSGTVTILAALTALLASPAWHPTRPVEFHWYSGEEEGLLGSHAVVRDYVANHVTVYGDLQLDMTGYFRPGTAPVVNLVDDFTTPTLMSFLDSLVQSYLDIPAVHGVCGYACTDHASWFEAGFPASHAGEARMIDTNPYMHSREDTLDKIDFNHMAEFAKLVVAYVVELSQAPTSAE
ncbi:Aste57867_18013 [Aphanomyces stellatus]|uniref:Aste57867_18013 protein n=1 Tax=Aphanomyces stellatus TaxID=120398 RepID=A0A485L8Z7_9STRA|nr:hypothetical protein As57867_017951 [Aphanomyces stellatus]VFT94752.1 Aste57867_18013 [Aphanomyces stellatus]